MAASLSNHQMAVRQVIHSFTDQIFMGGLEMCYLQTDIVIKIDLDFICILVRPTSEIINKRPPGLIAPLLKFCNLLGNPPINTTKGRDLIFNEGIRLLNMADNI